jgi:hypothetical protein
VREALVDAVLALDCGNDTYVTVADIAIGSMTGAGSFSLELGGASAFTGELQLSNFLRPGGPTQIPAIPDEIIPGTPGASVAGSGLAASPAPVAARQPKKAGKQLATPIASTKGTRGGKLAALAAGTLLLLAAVAELDRRKMRAAMQTTAPTSPTSEA